jgi:hypothetical protein
MEPARMGSGLWLLFSTHRARKRFETKLSTNPVPIPPPTLTLPTQKRSSARRLFAPPVPCGRQTRWCAARPSRRRSVESDDGENEREDVKGSEKDRNQTASGPLWLAVNPGFEIVDVATDQMPVSAPGLHCSQADNSDQPSEGASGPGVPAEHCELRTANGQSESIEIQR